VEELEKENLVANFFDGNTLSWLPYVYHTFLLDLSVD